MRYLNIGDPIAFGFKTPPHLIEAVERALRDGHNGYGPSAGIAPAREAVAAEYTRDGLPVSRRSRVHHGRHVRRHRARARARSSTRAAKCWCRCRPIRSTRRCSRSSARGAVFYRTDPSRGWMPDLDHLAEPRDAGDARARDHRSEQSDRRRLLRPRRGARCSISPTGTGCSILADEVYGDLGFDGPVAPLRQPRSRRADHLVLEPVEGVSRAGLAHRLDGASAGRRGWTMWSTAVKKLADGRLCSTVPMQYAIAAALNGDRSHQVAFRAALKERADLTIVAAERDARRHLRRADRGVLRDAAGDAAAGQDRRGLRARRCCARPACCASTDPASACRPRRASCASCFWRSPDELTEIYDLMAASRHSTLQ